MVGRTQGEMCIGILGLGHVGLPTALGFADLGWPVIGFDDDRAKAERIAAGQAPFFEPGIDELLHKHLQSGRFSVALDPEAAITQSHVLFVCVGTPQREDGSADLSQVENVARTIAAALNGYKVIVEKSTTPVRTAEQIKRTILRYRKGPHDFDVAVNPEFLREGSALADFLSPDRIVLGVESPRARQVLVRIHEPLLDRLRLGAGASADDRLLLTDLNTAEVIKHAANAFLATKISFINLIADLCEVSGADVTEVARGVGLDTRIGPAFLNAGLGFGGYCLPKDLRALIRIAQEAGLAAELLEAVEQINLRRIDRFVEKVRSAVWVLGGKTLAVLGLAFKPRTDDIREARSLAVIERLRAEGALLRLHDPHAMDTARRIVPEEAGAVVYCRSAYEAAEGAHALLVLTEWDEYCMLDFERIRGVMALPMIVDGRNCLDPARVRALGFDYIGMGR